MATTSTTPPSALTLEEAGKRLSVSIRTLYRLIDRGELRVVKIGARIRVPEAEIVRLLDVDREDRQ